MKNSEIQGALTQIAQTELGLSGPLPEGELAAHLDSVQRLTLVVAIEDHFHICFEADDIDGDMKRLQALGYRFTTESPSPGAHGTRVVFLHPKSTGGVLVELAEHPSR